MHSNMRGTKAGQGRSSSWISFRFSLSKFRSITLKYFALVCFCQLVSFLIWQTEESPKRKYEKIKFLDETIVFSETLGTKLKFQESQSSLRGVTDNNDSSKVKHSEKKEVLPKRNETKLEMEKYVFSDLLHGRVLREASQRILSRSIANSHVLIMTPDIKREIDLTNVDNISNRPSHIVINTAMSENHTTYGLPLTTNLNSWWENQKAQANANWFLMSYFISKKNDFDSIDTSFHPDRAGNFLNEATLTYIVVEVKSSRALNDGIQNNEDKTIQMSGPTAIQSLLDANFKVQLLASSHFFGYHPNFLFQSKEDVQQFLKEGAEFAHDGQFDALLFGTQGLDLAIPSRLSYIQLDNLHVCEEHRQNNTGRCDSKLNPRAIGNDIFIPCPSRHNQIQIDFDDSSPSGVQIKLDGKVTTKEEHENFEIWLGSSEPSQSEAACVRVKGSDSNSNKVSCTNRILPQESPPNMIEIKNSLARRKTRHNVLSIMIDPISRFQFLRSLPMTKLLLENLGFTSFGRYTSVGDNSGPNQCALFTGYPLSGGRDGVRNSKSHDGDNKKVWLWDSFKDNGYVTLKAEDICIKNSNMVQSMDPDTTHGKQLYQMFCFDFDRPNCLGKDMAAKHVMDHTEEFMKVYGNNGSDAGQPWAAFLSFIDSHEDTSTLISYLDELFVNFLQKIDLSNTIVIFTSDHGLHYGPSFLSNGERERSEPILFLHVPEKLQASKNLAKNKDLFTTPFDVYDTIVDGTALQNTMSSELGNSLLKKLPDSRKNCTSTPGIPSKFCALLSGQPVIKDGLELYLRKDQEQCKFMPTVPSVLSFYADIPRENRPSFPECKTNYTKEITSDECLCATKRHSRSNNWFPCTSNSTKEENTTDLLIRKCSHKTVPSETVEIDINIVRNDTLADEQIKKLPNMLNQSAKIDSLPNILFIEIDSVSRSAALRHLPKTMKVLQSHRIVYNESESKYSCPSGFCGAMFNKTSVIGQQSIPNQLAALSGCLNQEFLDIEKERQGLKKKKKLFCTAENENPWLFNITENLGYINFFAEEFCYEGSPYIIQDNYFPDKFHYNLNDLFCQLSEQKLDSKMWYQMEVDTSKNPNPCIAGKSRQEFAFEYIRGIWNAYPDIPKFAFLNSIPAHDYSIDIAYQPLGLEAYDEYLAGFVDEMLHRPDAENTIIVLRSDHGIQGGPLPIDFSSQVEHMNPFNNMIIPEQFHGLSIESLFSNQDKLVTGFDLYKTLRKIVVSSTLDDSSFHNANEKENKMLPWAYDLLKDVIPQSRNCLNARINAKYCPCLDERVDLMPYFYVGNSEYPGQLRKGKFMYDAEKGLYKAEAYPGKNKTLLT